jgi:hypothetical protein
MLPLPPPDVERNAPALAEFESVTRQIRASCHQVALLDRVHNIKVRPLLASFHLNLWIKDTCLYSKISIRPAPTPTPSTGEADPGGSTRRS